MTGAGFWNNFYGTVDALIAAGDWWISLILIVCLVGLAFWARYAWQVARKEM